MLISCIQWWRCSGHVWHPWHRSVSRLYFHWGQAAVSIHELERLVAGMTVQQIVYPGFHMIAASENRDSDCQQQASLSPRAWEGWQLGLCPDACRQHGPSDSHGHLSYCSGARWDVLEDVRRPITLTINRQQMPQLESCVRTRWDGKTMDVHAFHRVQCGQWSPLCQYPTNVFHIEEEDYTIGSGNLLSRLPSVAVIPTKVRAIGDQSLTRFLRNPAF